MLRHCDKPIDPRDSCCSDVGHQREQRWSTFLHRYLDKGSIIKLYASNFHSIQTCGYHIDYTLMTTTPKKHCQKSQRMYSSAYCIKKNLESLKYEVISYIDTNNCIGQETDVLHSITNSTQVTDAILIWQHDEILDIIRSYGIPIESFEKSDKNVYDIAFMVDTSSKKLYYECFQYYDSSSLSSCQTAINTWLKKFSAGTIEYYRHTHSTHKDQDVGFLTYFIILSLAIVMLYFIYLLLTFVITCANRRSYTNVL